MKKAFLIFLIVSLAGALGHAPLLAAQPSSEPTAGSISLSDDHKRLLELVDKSKTAFESIQDYTALFKKHEPKDGKPDEIEEIFLKFEKPFKIFMSWQTGRKKGLQVMYERGKHDNKLAIHQPGLLFGLAQVVFLDQSSPWVREGSASFNIEDAGIGTFLTDFAKAVSHALGAPGFHGLPFEVKPLPHDGGGLEKFEVIFTKAQKDGVYFAKRIIVGYDKEFGMPLYHELYDWDDRWIGTYSYENIKPNVGSKDAEFKKHINRRLYRVYAGESKD